MNQQKKLSSRETRRVLGAVAPTIGQLAHNDGVIQQQVAKLDADLTAWKEVTSREHIYVSNFRAMSFMQRLRWLLKGEQ